jgi:peptide/nickel transport system ATP-binding protein
MTELLKVSDLTLEYRSGHSNHIAVDSASFEILSAGQSIGIVGESGSGKSTLALSILRLSAAKVISGEIRYLGKNIFDMKQEELRKYRWSEVAMIFQSAMNSLNPVKNVSSHITEVLTEHTIISKQEAKQKAIDLLSRVGISTERVNDYPHQFSGGMIQRVFIAMALALSPKILICDEPTSALDVVVQKTILKLLKKEATTHSISLIFITHEIALLSDLVREVIVMYAGEIVEIGPLEKVLFEPLHPYTQMLLASILTLDSEFKKADSYASPETKKRTIPIIGCKYSHKCPFAFERCRVQKPLMREMGNGRRVACHKY